ncbi:MAG: hypothetical protein AB9835_01855 [Eubacteriales bacterium]
MRYKPPVTRGVGGFFTNTPDDVDKEDKIDDPLIVTINTKVFEYYKEHNEKPNALILGCQIYQNLDKDYIKWLRSRGVIIVVIYTKDDIIIGKIAGQ